MEETTICWYCEKEIPYEESGKRAYCHECKKIVQDEHEKLINEYLKNKALIMYENAITKMEEQKINMHYYYEACGVVKERILKDCNTFDSALEIMACIELINNEIKVKPQVEFGKYKVDFLLPDLKIVLEIDGYWHNSSKVMLRDAKRDVEILNELGSGWEIIRVKTSQIEKRLAYLVDDIKKIHKERQLLRKKNMGILPDNYNEHTKILYKDMLGLYKYDSAYLTQTERQEIKNSVELKCYGRGKKNSDYYKIREYFESKKNNV